MTKPTFLKLHGAYIQSGLTIAAFCRKKKIPQANFHYWKRKYNSASHTKDFVELKLDVVETASVSPVIRLNISNFSFELPEGFSASTFSLAIRCLKEEGLC